MRPITRRSPWREALLLLALAACTPEAAPEPDPPPPADPEELMAADRQFAADVASGGAQAWASWFEDGGAMVQPGLGEIRGRDDILAVMAGLDAGQSLTWEPTRAEIASAGDMGYTVGRWTSTGPQGDQTHGVYVSVWRRQADGSWKVSIDLGNPVGEGPWPEATAGG